MIINTSIKEIVILENSFQKKKIAPLFEYSYTEVLYVFLETLEHVHPKFNNE